MVNLTFCGFFFHLLVLVAMGVEEVTFGFHFFMPNIIKSCYGWLPFELHHNFEKNNPWWP